MSNLYRAVPADHRIVFHYCDKPYLIGGRIYQDVVIPLVERLQRHDYPDCHYTHSYYPALSWVIVGVFDIPVLAESEIPLDLGVVT